MIEQTFFALLSNFFVEKFVDYLHMMDEQMMELGDKNRYRLKDQREWTIQTLFGEVTFQRRLYEDRKTGQTVYLLDQYLSIEERKPISPHLEEWAIRLTAEGTSYRKAANLLKARETFGKDLENASFNTMTLMRRPGGLWVEMGPNGLKHARTIFGT